MLCNSVTNCELKLLNKLELFIKCNDYKRVHDISVICNKKFSNFIKENEQCLPSKTQAW